MRAGSSAEQRSTELHERADATKSQISLWWRDLQEQWNEQVTQIRSDMDAKREEHDVKRAAARADNAEAEAEFAISIAMAAIDEAEYACMEAVVARDQPANSPPPRPSPKRTGVVPVGPHGSIGCVVRECAASRSLTTKRCSRTHCRSSHQFRRFWQ